MSDRSPAPASEGADVAEGDWHRVGSIEDLVPGALRGALVAGHKLCIGRGATGPFAVADTCPHAGGSLSEGLIDGSEIVCPLHAWGFDLETGESPDDPNCRLRVYPVRIVGDALEVRID